nr:hypothetical protein [Tanacetum cinerariifolium]
RDLHASEHMMMTSIEEVNLRISYQAQVHRQESKYFYTQLHDAQTDRRDTRLEIDVVRGQRITYETELQETDRRDIRLEIDVVRGQRTAYEIELHENAEDLAVTQMMRIHTLEARACTNTVEDTDSSC